MERWLPCGKYNCCIAGSDDLVRFVPSGWSGAEKAQTHYSETITIRLETATIAGENVLSDGWIYNLQKAVYIQNGKTIFALQSRKKNEVTVYVQRALEGYVRSGIQFGIMMALHQQCVGLHGVTLVCGNEIVILSAPSGTGKTTLAKLLEKYCDAVVVNGDFALLTPTEDGVIYEPTPFCGSSGRALNHRLRINRVVFLGQAKENVWHDLTGREAMKRFMSNVFVPDWDNRLQQTVQGNILKCISSLKVNAYDFAPTQEAVEVFLKQIEEDSSLHVD